MIYGYSQVDDETKVRHINSINSKYKKDELIHMTAEEAASETEWDITDTIESEQADQNADTESSCDAIKTEKDPLRCPRCGAYLLLRQARRGANSGKSFYGCSNYPKCRYILNCEANSQPTDTQISD